MNTRIILIIALISVLLLALTSCTPAVTIKEYDALKSELLNTKSQLLSIQEELSTSKSELSEVQGELSTSKSELSEVQGELSTSLDAKNRAKAKMEVLNQIFIPALTGELDYISEGASLNLLLKWQDNIVDIDDPILTAKFDALMDTLDDKESLDFFIYLLQSIEDDLQ